VYLHGNDTVTSFLLKTFSIYCTLKKAKIQAVQKNFFLHGNKRQIQRIFAVHKSPALKNNKLTSLIKHKGGGQMRKNKKTKGFLRSKAVERHDTAAWADMKENKPVSKVSKPHEIDVRNAKEYVDSNQK
jgi:hypothetical protein